MWDGCLAHPAVNRLINSWPCTGTNCSVGLSHNNWLFATSCLENSYRTTPRSRLHEWMKKVNSPLDPVPSKHKLPSRFQCYASVAALVLRLQHLLSDVPASTRRVFLSGCRQFVSARMPRPHTHFCSTFCPRTADCNWASASERKWHTDAGKTGSAHGLALQKHKPWDTLSIVIST